MDNSEAIAVLRHMLENYRLMEWNTAQRKAEALELAIRALQDQEGQSAND